MFLDIIQKIRSFERFRVFNNKNSEILNYRFLIATEDERNETQKSLMNRNNNLSKRQKDRETERLGYLFLANRNNNLSNYLRGDCSIH
jgi:hypothetical protein